MERELDKKARELDEYIAKSNSEMAALRSLLFANGIAVDSESLQITTNYVEDGKVQQYDPDGGDIEMAVESIKEGMI